MEEDHLYALRWKELEMHSLALQNTLHKRTWTDEKNMLQQELRSLKQNIFLFYVKLRWLLKHWRQRKQMEEGEEDFVEVMPPTHLDHLVCICCILGNHPQPTALSIVSLVFIYLSVLIQAIEMERPIQAHTHTHKIDLNVGLGLGSKSISIFNSTLKQSAHISPFCCG